jgi:predicted metalloprotease with PDZ domain
MTRLASSTTVQIHLGMSPFTWHPMLHGRCRLRRLVAVITRVVAAGWLALFGRPLLAQSLEGPGALLPTSAPVSNLRYEVTLDSTTAAMHQIDVVTIMTVDGPGPVILSLPAWTPGAYQMVWFARWVTAFRPTDASGRALTWGMLDYQTWRIDPAGSQQIRVAFTYTADTLDNAMSWTRSDFGYFNGTNLFLYPHGRSLDFPATVVIRSSSGWRVATGMTPLPDHPSTFTAQTYHDLVDMPFFVGRFALDSAQVAGHWIRFANYPVDAITHAQRATVLKWLSAVIPIEAAVFDTIPWSRYTVLQVSDSAHRGTSVLEHQSSQLGIGDAARTDYPFTPGVYAHEIFHSWNVKRMRPADLTPYRYDVPQPTPWLWVSEGITDYYADLAVVRSGIAGDSMFYHLTTRKIDQVDAAAPVALTDESLSTWIHPIGAPGFRWLYYPKGSLVGFMLDILIRDASDDRASLDSVMRAVYRTTYERHRGFTSADWWGAVSHAAGGRSFDEFDRRYVEGRSAFPWDSVLALGGLRLVGDTLHEPTLGVEDEPDTGGRRIIRVDTASPAAAAGLRPGDLVLSIAGLFVASPDFAEQFQARYANYPVVPTSVPVILYRSGQPLAVQMPLTIRTQLVHRIVPDSAASAKAIRIRTSILRGPRTVRE